MVYNQYVEITFKP